MFLTILCFLSEVLKKTEDVVEEKGKRKEKTFQFYLNLPEEIRRPMIDKMQARDRCAFAGTAKLCYKEAKACKHYIYKIALEELSQKIRISVIFSEQYSTFLNMEFDNSPSNKSVKLFPKRYWDQNEVPLDEKKYDDSMDMVEYSVEHFKKLLQFYKKSIRSLRITGAVFSEQLGDCDFGLEELSNLEELTIYSIYIDRILPKLQHPLKKLKIHQKSNDRDDGVHHEQIYQVQDSLICRYTRFRNEQLTRLTAKNAEMYIASLSTTNICNFIRSWQDGTIRQQIEKYTWFGLHKVDFPQDHIFHFFGVRVEPPKYVPIRFKHYNDPGKTALLTYNSCAGKLVFEVENGLVEQEKSIRIY